MNNAQYFQWLLDQLNEHLQKPTNFRDGETTAITLELTRMQNRVHHAELLGELKKLTAAIESLLPSQHITGPR